MQTGLHALTWGLQRLGVALGLLMLAAFSAYVIWVFVIIAGQGVAGLSQ